MENIIEFRDVRKRYRGFELRGVSFDVPRGYIMGLIGPNGAGKTTLMKMVMNLVLRAGFMGMLYGLVGLQVVGVAVTALARSWSPLRAGHRLRPADRSRPAHPARPSRRPRVSRRRLRRALRPLCPVVPRRRRALPAEGGVKP